jgi:protoporphyrinogen oxidase
MLKAPIRIVGGGMTGLTLAYRCARQGLRVVVHERDPYLGGLAGEGVIGGIPVERFYHCILPTDTALVGLLVELGLGQEIGWTRTRTGFFWRGQLLEMTKTHDLLRFPALDAVDRMRLGWSVAWCGANPRWERLDDEPVGTFLKRHAGENAFREIWEPLLLAKLGADYNRFAASYIWAFIARMLSARRSKGLSEKLGFVRGRYGKVFQSLRRAIEFHGGEVHTGEEVLAVRKSNSGIGTWVVQSTSEQHHASAVILAVPSPIAARLSQDISPSQRERLSAVEYLGVICDVLLLNRPLTPYYILNQTDRSIPLTGVIGFTNLTGTSEFGGRSVVYAPRYRDHKSPLWDESDHSVHNQTVGDLKKIVPEFDPSWVEAWQVNRARHVQPVNHVGRRSKLPPVSLGDGLFHLSSALIHPYPVFNDEIVRLVDRSFPAIISEIRQGSPAGVPERREGLRRYPGDVSTVMAIEDSPA